MNNNNNDIEAKQYKGKSLIILGVARRIFAEKGFNNVSTRELAQKANVNEVTIFRNFGSKENLLSEVLRFIEYKPNWNGDINLLNSNLNEFLNQFANLLYDTSEKNLDFNKIKWSMSNFQNGGLEINDQMKESTEVLIKHLQKIQGFHDRESATFAKAFISALTGIFENKLIYNYFEDESMFRASLNLLTKQFSNDI